MAEEGRCTGQRHRRLTHARVEAEQQNIGQADGGCALTRIADKRHGRQVLAAGAQDIGRADIA